MTTMTCSVIVAPFTRADLTGLLRAAIEAGLPLVRWVEYTGRAAVLYVDERDAVDTWARHAGQQPTGVGGWWQVSYVEAGHRITIRAKD